MIYTSCVEGRATHYTARVLTGSEATDADAQEAAVEGAQAIGRAMEARNDSASEDATIYALNVDTKRGRWAVYVHVLGQKPAGTI